MHDRLDTVDGSVIGWTCPVCENYNRRAELLCDTCGYMRDEDFPMDDDLPSDSGPEEP